MKRRSPWLCCVLTALLSGHAAALVAGMTQVPVVRLDTSIEVAASPAEVWSFMTQGKNLVTWCPNWKSEANKAIDLKKVGDVLEFVDEWGNGGRSIVTYLDPNQELRVAHEPTDGSYLCQAKLLLEPTSTGTRIRYVEQYTDESSPQDLGATAHQMEGEMQSTLEALKAGVEGR